MSDLREKSRRSVLDESSEFDALVLKKGRTTADIPDIWHSRFVEFFEFSPIPFIVLSYNSITEVNVSACELFGLGIGKIKKRTFDSFFLHPEKIKALLEEVRQCPTTVESIVSLTSGDRVRIHAVKFLQNGEKIRIGLTKEISDPRDISRLRHVMLAAQDAICIYSLDKQLLSNKAARILLRNHDSNSLVGLLLSLHVEESVAKIDVSLESTNLWKRPVSLDGLPYQLTISHIYYELSSLCEYLVKLSPLENSEENSLSKQARSVDSVSDLALTPLTVIKSATSLLKTLDPESESFTKVLALLESNADVLGALFGGLSALSQQNLVFESVPIVAILSDAVEHVRKISELDIEIEVEDPSLLIWVERDIAVKVLFELLLKCTRKSVGHALRIVLEESSTHLSFNIFSLRAVKDEPEIYLKKTREMLKQMGADVHKIPAENGERCCITVIFLRGKRST